VLGERKPLLRQKTQPKVVGDFNPDFRIWISAGSLPRCCGFITLSVSVILPSMKVGRLLYDKC